ncbi:MAG: hypothetical protein IT163_09845 [Bryobacterales bacterium]|nr:hypothetical protein [Bryobacterales bacterium]
MANIDNPSGLTCLGKCTGGGHPQVDLFTKVVGYNKAIFPGDAVNQVADGSIETSATPGTTLYSGVALNYGAALTATEHLVIFTPDAVFEAQDDGDSDTMTAADIGLNANLILGAGVVATLKSGHEIDTNTADVGAGLDVKLLRKANKPNNAWGANVRMEIAFNKQRFALGVAGI